MVNPNQPGRIEKAVGTTILVNDHPSLKFTKKITVSASDIKACSETIKQNPHNTVRVEYAAELFSKTDYIQNNKLPRGKHVWHVNPKNRTKPLLAFAMATEHHDSPDSPFLKLDLLVSNKTGLEIMRATQLLVRRARQC